MFFRSISRFSGNLLLIPVTAFLLNACKKDKEDVPELGTCKSVPLGPGLSRVNATQYLYESSTGAIIRIDRITPGGLVINMSDRNYSNLSIEFWGGSDDHQTPSPASHENLNGKHIKDKVGTNRTLIFPGGTKITTVATAPWHFGEVTAISIYDGDIVHHFNISCFKLEYSTVNGIIAKLLEEAQPDGETSTYEFTETGLIYYNIYTEDTPGNKVEKRENLGGLERSQPNLINDYYDDPRIGHT
jgi:hypothetical protein